MGTICNGIIRSFNWRQILIGLLALFLGLLFYLIGRPPDQTYFVRLLNLDFSLYGILPSIYFPFRNNLPTFIHVFSFILITSGLLACRKKGYLIICMCWCIIDFAFELGQKFKPAFVKMIPERFSQIPILENTESYILYGTFDVGDLAAITTGTAMAYFLLLTTHSEKGVTSDESFEKQNS
jgi:hypothetical protein